MLKRLLSHSLIYSLAPQVPKIASLFLMPLVTRDLTPADYGVYGIITSYLYSISALKELGFNVVFVNTYYRHPNNWKLIWRLLHGHLTVWAVLYSLLTLGILWIALPRSAAGHFWEISFYTILPTILFANTGSIASYYFRFSQQPLVVASISAASGVTSIVTTYYCIVVRHMGYMGWFVGSFAASLIMFLLYFYPLYFRLGLWPILRFRPRFITPHLKVALPMVPHNYSTYLLNSSDRVVMDLYKVNERQIGLYNVAYTFGNYFEAIGEAVGMAVGPFFSKLFSTKTEKAQADERLLTFFLMGCFLSATFVASLWLREIFNLLISNPALRTEYPIGILIIMGYAYRPMYWSAGIKLSVANKTSMLWRISLVAGLLNVGLNLIFVPFFGIYAAAISTLISLLYIGFSGFFLRPYREIPGIEHFPLRWMSAILAMTATVYLLRDVSVPFKFILTAAMLVSGALMFRKYHKDLVGIEI